LRVVVDTSVWSLALRRKSVIDQSVLRNLESLIHDFRVQLIGPIRQELLSGIKSENQFKKLKTYLRSFPDYNIQAEDHELAAEYYNQCRRKGIQGSNTNFLICSVAVNNSWQIFTTDEDFLNFGKIIPIQLYISNL
jgi:predicted nucleic acid-binding protein